MAPNSSAYCTHYLINLQVLIHLFIYWKYLISLDWMGGWVEAKWSSFNLIVAAAVEMLWQRSQDRWSGHLESLDCKFSLVIFSSQILPSFTCQAPSGWPQHQPCWRFLVQPAVFDQLFACPAPYLSLRLHGQGWDYYCATFWPRLFNATHLAEYPQFCTPWVWQIRYQLFS